MYVLQDVQCISAVAIVNLYVTDVFAIPKCQVVADLSYVCLVLSRQYVHLAGGGGEGHQIK